MNRRNLILGAAASVVASPLVAAQQREEVKLLSLDTKAGLVLNAFGQVHLLEDPQKFFSTQLIPMMLEIGALAKTTPELNMILTKYVEYMRNANGDRVWP